MEGFEVPVEHYSDRHSFHWEIFSSLANAKKLMKNVGLISTDHFSTKNADFSGLHKRHCVFVDITRVT